LVGGTKVRTRDLERGQEIRVYLTINEIARPDINEITLTTADNLLVSHEAQNGVAIIKPARVTTAVVVTEALVESFDAETRELKLIDVDGNRMTIIADERVGSLTDLQASDRITVEYLEIVAIVIAPEGSESASGSAEVLAASADQERPAVVSADTTVIMASVEAFSAADRGATLGL
jgi:hypothetical protein